MQRIIEITVTALLVTLIGATGSSAADLVVTKFRDVAGGPVLKESVFQCPNVSVGKCDGGSLRVTNRSHRPIVLSWKVRGTNFNSESWGAANFFGTDESGAYFSVSGCNHDQQLTPGKACLISVDFCPQTAGAKDGRLEIFQNWGIAYSFRLKGTAKKSRTTKPATPPNKEEYSAGTGHGL